jgi:hypothetical protein
MLPCRQSLLAFVLCLGASLVVRPAQAHTTEPGSTNLGVLLGPSLSLGSALGASTAYGSVGGQAEYTFDSVISAVFDLVGSFGSNIDLRLHVGPRWRLPHGGLPLVPYLQLQFVMGRLFDVVNADLQFLGGRAAIGLEYYITHTFNLGAQLGVDLGSSAGERPAFYGVAEGLLTASWGFGSTSDY